jgi:shikimate dehydrogenase
VARRRETRLFGVLGDPVDHSLSPAMHNAAFAATGLPHVYLRYRVPLAALPEALGEARQLGMRGLNLTVPLKEAVLPLVDALTPEAARIGAANTLVLDGRRVVADNTDGRGFLAALRGRVALRGAHAVLIGAGGSARAVGAALAGSGCTRLTIANRTPARAEALAERLRRLGRADTRVVGLEALAGGDVLADAALVVNTTPVGLAGRGVRVRAGASPRGCLFVDLVYDPRPTPFLAGAARAGRPTLDGSGMLLEQGALAFEAWTGRRAPRAAMARALRAAGLAVAPPALTRLEAAASLRARRPPRP